MELNAKKTKDMWITFKKSCPSPAPINIGPTELERVSYLNYWVYMYRTISIILPPMLAK